ncbi:MAG: glutathione S-transferase N-terminal domain-containing protein [Novosphingobium sp.]
MSNLRLYGHPFSSYTWKALIALYANATPFTFCVVDPDHPENGELVRKASPQGKFPALAAWRKHLLALPAVARCVDDARPYRAYFPTATRRPSWLNLTTPLSGAATSSGRPISCAPFWALPPRRLSAIS